MKFNRRFTKYVLIMISLLYASSTVTIAAYAEQNSNSISQNDFWEKKYWDEEVLVKNLTKENTWISHQYVSYIVSHSNNNTSIGCTSVQKSTTNTSDTFPPGLPSEAYVLLGIVQNFTYVVSSIYYTHHVFINILFPRIADHVGVHFKPFFHK